MTPLAAVYAIDGGTTMPPQAIILVVEDNAAVTAALDEMLSFHDYRIITADSV